MRITWVEYFLKIAVAVSERSQDPSTKVGAVIVGEDHEIVSTGYNGPPRGVNMLPEEMEVRDTKLLFTAHAEENAIVNAAMCGAHTKGCTIYVSSLPCCAGCARMIINAGIKRVVLLDSTVPSRWEHSISVAYAMFDRANIEVVFADAGTKKRVLKGSET